VNGVDPKRDLPPITHTSLVIMMGCIWICFLVAALCSVIGVITLYIEVLPFALFVGLTIAAAVLLCVILVTLLLIPALLMQLNVRNKL
jgi:hypothetical protein